SPCLAPDVCVADTSEADASRSAPAAPPAVIDVADKTAATDLRKRAVEREELVGGEALRRRIESDRRAVARPRGVDRVQSLAAACGIPHHIAHRCEQVRVVDDVLAPEARPEGVVDSPKPCVRST